MCEQQTPSLYLSDFTDMEALRQLTSQGGNINHSYMQGGVPGSPHQQRNILPNVFNFGLSDQQFQNQLLQRLQNINPPFRQSQLYPVVGNLYTPQTQQSSPQHQFNLRVSQASSYTGSPVLPHKQQDQEDTSQFIRPLSQGGTITTTESDGRARVLVGSDEDPKDFPRLDPPPSGAKRKEPSSPGKRQEQLAATLAALRVSTEEDEPRRPVSGLMQNGPFIQRSTSEKVPNRSELMSQVQRTAWARHTTK